MFFKKLLLEMINVSYFYRYLRFDMPEAEQITIVQMNLQIIQEIYH